MTNVTTNIDSVTVAIFHDEFYNSDKIWSLYVTVCKVEHTVTVCDQLLSRCVTAVHEIREINVPPCVSVP